MSSVENNFEETIQQLQTSGVLFCIEYVGSVVVEKSINSLSPEKQAQLARSCMRLVTDKQSHQAEDSNHDDALRTYVHGPVVPHRRDVELNISSSAIILIDTPTMRPLHRFKIQDVSLLSPGFDELSTFFCFFAKVLQVPGQSQQWVRKCFVFNAHTEMTDVRDAICFAFRLNEINGEHNNNNNNNSIDCNGTSPSTSTNGMGSNRDDMRTPIPSSTPPTPVCDEPRLAGSASSAMIPEIRIADQLDFPPPELPPRPRRYTAGGNVGMECGNNSRKQLVTPAPRQSRSRSGTMGSGGTTIAQWRNSIGGGLRSSSVSSASTIRDDCSITISPERYKEIAKDVHKQSWFHDVLSRLDAELLVHQNGQFLIRQSPKIEYQHQFVLVAMHNDEVRHVCLVNAEGKLQTTIGEFQNVVDLIKYFHGSGQPLMLEQECGSLYLLHPIARVRKAL